MAYNPVSARRLPAEDPFFGANSSNLPAVSGASQAYGPYSYHPPAYGSPQHQRGWGPISPPTAASYFPQPFANQRNWGLVASPTAGSDLAQMPTNQQESALGKSPIPGRDLAQLPTNQREFSIADSSNPGEQVRVEQQNSVKHLTCWYWANKGCRLPEHVCLYSHYDTGRLADPPVQVQRGRECSSHHPSLKFRLLSQTSL